MAMSDFTVAMILLGVLGVLLIVFQQPVMERFTNPSNPTRCGVDQPPCEHPLKCINGFCRKSTPVPREDSDPVPLLRSPDDAPYAQVD